VPTKGEHSYGEECKCTQILKISLETLVNKIIEITIIIATNIINIATHTHNKPIIINDVNK